MSMNASALPDDIRSLLEQLDAIDADAASLVDGLTEEQGRRQPVPGSWSVAECLDHLATSNRVYLTTMEPAAAYARRNGKMRRGLAKPGFLGAMFVRSLEPPARKSIFAPTAPRIIQPREAPALADAYRSFMQSQQDARVFLRRNADIDLGTRFTNPFVRGIRFNLATGLNVITSHDRRHIWQAWNVRRAIDIDHRNKGAASNG
jgi:hypothetical protein